jgi:hypothetical protein
MTLARFSLICLSLVWLLPAAGCSGFNREWRAATARPLPAPAIAGPWTGDWRSSVNGHRGQLRALLTPVDEETFQARFRARFWGIMSYSYSLELTAEPVSPGHWRLKGESDLGWLAGGIFQCRGMASADFLQATFDSKRDRGTFILSRPTIKPKS